MQYRVDKKSGNKLSILGLGCMRFPRNIAGIDMRKAEEMVMRSIEGGVNYFDTAWMYPGSEEALGAIFEKNHVREKVYIATKLPLILVKSPADCMRRVHTKGMYPETNTLPKQPTPPQSGWGMADFDKYFDQSLKRLKTDYIDYYLLHMVTDMDQWEKLKSRGITDWIAEKKKSGRIRQIGFSFHGSCPDFLKLIDDYDWDISLIQYNYSDENFQAGVTGLKKAAEKMPVVIMEPLLGGRLATGLPREAVAVFKKLKPHLSPAAWALNWVWNQEEAAVLLSGMSDMAQLEENMRTAETARAGMLTEPEQAAYCEALAVINRACKIRCTGCNYCMPCPQGVNIPGCFSAYNAVYSMGYVAGMHQFVTSTGLTSEHSGSPRQCVRCGKCETHCPQNIPIMRYLKQVERCMEPFWVKFIGVCARAFLGKKRKK